MREISRVPNGERKWPWVREFAYTSGAPRPKLVIEGSWRRFGAERARRRNSGAGYGVPAHDPIDPFVVLLGWAPCPWNESFQLAGQASITQRLKRL